MSYEHLKPIDRRRSIKSQAILMASLAVLAAAGKSAWDNREVGQEIYDNRDRIGTEVFSSASTKVAEILATDTPTITPIPTETSISTETPRPTRTAESTETSVRTKTAEATATARPRPTAAAQELQDGQEVSTNAESFLFSRISHMFVKPGDYDDAERTLTYFGNYEVDSSAWFHTVDDFVLKGYTIVEDGHFVNKQAEIYALEGDKLVGPFEQVYFSGDEMNTDFDNEEFWRNPRQLDGQREIFQPNTDGIRPMGGSFSGRIRIFEYQTESTGLVSSDTKLVETTYFSVGPVTVKRGELSAAQIWQKGEDGIVRSVGDGINSFNFNVGQKDAAFIYERGPITPAGFDLPTPSPATAIPVETATSTEAPSETVVPTETEVLTETVTREAVQALAEKEVTKVVASMGINATEEMIREATAQATEQVMAETEGGAVDVTLVAIILIIVAIAAAAITNDPSSRY